MKHRKPYRQFRLISACDILSGILTGLTGDIIILIGLFALALKVGG